MSPIISNTPSRASLSCIIMYAGINITLVFALRWSVLTLLLLLFIISAAPILQVNCIPLMPKIHCFYAKVLSLFLLMVPNPIISIIPKDPYHHRYFACLLPIIVATYL
ncbi:hypothetical protein QL285_081420 [Trifolium repens]|nr:hypothetical protein QL285_081420 [Trifolium repens]